MDAVESKAPSSKWGMDHKIKERFIPPPVEVGEFSLYHVKKKGGNDMILYIRIALIILLLLDLASILLDIYVRKKHKDVPCGVWGSAP